MTREGQSACWIEEREVSIQIQVVIPGGWKSQSEFSIIQYYTDPVKYVMEEKKRFLVDGIVIERPTTHIVIMPLLKTP